MGVWVGLLALFVVPPSISETDAACRIFADEAGGFVTISAGYNPQEILSGSFLIRIELRRSGNVSVSQQSGRLSETGKRHGEFNLVSSSKLYIQDGSRLKAALVLENEKTTERCELDLQY